MKRYLIAIGGSGAQLIRAAVVAASADLLADRRGYPIQELKLLLVDTDRDNGQAVDAQNAVVAYEAVRTMYEGFSWAHHGFHTALTLRQWPLVHGQEDPLAAMTMDTGADRLLADCLLTGDSREAAQGLSGRADAGALVFADALLHPEAHAAWRNLLASLKADLADDDAQVLLCGSLWGGTGAAGLSALAVALRQAFPDQPRLTISALALLPYVVTGTDALTEHKAVAREALCRCAADGLFDSVWALGMPDGALMTPDHPVAGGAQQHLPAHAVHLAALACLCDACAREKAQIRQGGLHSFYIARDGFGWDAFGQDGARYRLALGRLYKAAALWLSGLGGEIAEAAEKADRKQIRSVNYLAAYFDELPRMTEGERAALGDGAAQITALMGMVAGWIGEVMRTMPVELRSAGALTEATVQAGSAYRQLLDAVGELGVMDEEINSSGMRDDQPVTRGKPKETDVDRLIREAEMRREAVAELEREQARLDTLIGGERTLALRQQMLDGIRRAMDEEGRRLDRERAAITVSAHEATEALETRRAAFFRLEHHHRCLGYEAVYVEKAIEQAKADGITSIPPQLTEGSGAAGTGLFDTVMAEAVTALSQGDAPEAAALVQQDWEQLLAGSPRDEVTAADVFAGLGAARGCKADAALPMLLARILAWSVKEV